MMPIMPIKICRALLLITHQTKNILALTAAISLGIVSTSCATFHEVSLPGMSAAPASTDNVSPGANASISNDPNFWQGDNASIWARLQPFTQTELTNAISQNPNALSIGWLKLALISKEASLSSAALSSQLLAWRKSFPDHPANSMLPNNDTLMTLQTAQATQHIALLLPLQGNLGHSGQLVRAGFLNSYYATAHTNDQTVSFYDTSLNKNIPALYQQAVAEGATAIIGPLTKEEVRALLNQTISVPTLALNYTTESFSSLPTHFYEFGLLPQDEALQLADKAWANGHKHALIITPQTPWGQQMLATLQARWVSLGGSVVDKLAFGPSTNFATSIADLLKVDIKQDRKKMQSENNKALLEQQRRQDFDVIFLLAQPVVARQIVPLLHYYYAESIPVYSTSIIYSGTPSPQKDGDLNGVTFCDAPWIFKIAHNEITAPSNVDRLYAVGQDAFLLSQQFNRLAALPEFPFYGATGALYLNAQHKFYRRLPWSQFHAGKP
jgi:outer membrane PBP1 activator LpoA protein